MPVLVKVPAGPMVTDPADQTVTAGDTASFAVETTGVPTPVVSWELSSDGGDTWNAVTADDGTVSTDGKSLTVTATEAMSGTQYRAVATNSVDTAVSAAATLTVTPVPVAPVTPPTTDPVTPPATDSAGAQDLARTGSDPVPTILVAVLFALVGAGLVLTSRRKQA